jgi:microcystin-dependent protein
VYQYDHPTAAAVEPARAAAGDVGFYRNGNPGGGVAASILDADHLNAMQNELLNVLTDAGITPDKGDDTQLSAAIAAIAATIAGGAAGSTGDIKMRAVSSVPGGWLECDGAAVSRATYAALFGEIGTTYGVGNGTTTFNLPDMRGEFPRGWDHGRGIDAARTLGSTQADQFAAHTHTLPNQNSGSTSNSSINVTGGGGAAQATGSAGTGTETRPRNVALMFVIKT